MSKDTILIVDDEPFFSSLLENILEDNYQIIIVNNSEETLDILDNNPVDLILLDIVMPKESGYDVCEKIKSRKPFSAIPIIFLSAKSGIEDEIKGFDLGAVDYITKPISPPTVKARIDTHMALATATKKLQQQAHELEHMVSLRTIELTKEIAEKQEVSEKLLYLANYDQLTLLPNRNLFNERLTYAHELAKRNKISFALLLIDLDRFKNVNDTLGHHIGDIILKQVAQRLAACVRGVDSVARVGGDEFTIILTELKHKEDAAIVAEKVVLEISRPFKIEDKTINIGCSIGISTFPDNGTDLNAMRINADLAMYDVKEKGKNGHAFFSPEMKL